MLKSFTNNLLNGLSSNLLCDLFNSMASDPYNRHGTANELHKDRTTSGLAVPTLDNILLTEA